MAGCAITAVPVGEPVYGPPAVVEEPPVAVWGWAPWPHYEVEHHYTVEDEHVVIHDRHYFPTYGRSRAYIRNDNDYRLIVVSPSGATPTLVAAGFDPPH